MKEFELPVVYGGVQLHVIVCCRTKKEACRILDASLHYLNKWAYQREPKTEIAIRDPYSRFAYYDSGWLREVKPEWFRKVVKYSDLTKFIDEANKIRYENTL